MVWRKCADLPVAKSAPSVVRIEDSVYVSEGFTEFGNSYDIMKYSLSQDAWMPLPSCPTHQHGLATLNKELIVIGGIKDSSHRGTNEVYTFRGNDWVEDLPPMPTPRSLLSTASHEDRLVIAAGGVKEAKSNGEFVQTEAVEIIKDRQWYTTRRLPYPISSFSICIVDDTCYALGGYAVSYSTLSTLLDHAEPCRYSVLQSPGPCDMENT